uniref:F0F1 ATP synthase subunit B n=1 Tax=Prevotella sp. TaxID=59823 RepID=UPI003FEE4FB6
MSFDTLPSILTPNPGLLFWMLLAFLVVFFVLARYGLPAILNMVDQRNQYINENLQKAQQAALQLENIKQESESLIQEAREKQASILKEAAATRDAIVEKAQEKAHEEGARILAEAKAEIENQKQVAINEIRKQVAILSVEVSGKILRKKLSADDAQMDYINGMLDEVTASSNKLN